MSFKVQTSRHRCRSFQSLHKFSWTALSKFIFVCNILSHLQKFKQYIIIIS